MSAHRPSKRRHKINGDVELSLIPVMSLLVVLVPMLLQTAVFEQISSVQLSLPSADDVTYMTEPPTQAQQKESVTLAVTSEGFRLLSGEETVAEVPVTEEGTFDFDALDEKLSEIKERFSHQEAIILLVENEVVYNDIIHTMDEARKHFPGVSLADLAGFEEAAGE